MNTVLAVALIAFAPRQSGERSEFWFGYMGGRVSIDAGTVWCDYLVERLPITTPTGFLAIGRSARRSLDDFFRRMDRPIMQQISTTMKETPAKSPEDDLAEGISFWTLQWGMKVSKKGEFLRYHTLAEKYLRKAAKEGDIVQRSFADLAYAYCSLLTMDDAYYPGNRDRFGTHFSRRQEFARRLQYVYKTYRRTVPERALRAASELQELYGHMGSWKAQEKERALIEAEFRSLSHRSSYAVRKHYVE